MEETEMPEIELPLVPARMLNEFVYCPRLAVLEWVDGEFAHSADTVEGVLRHRSVDRPGRRFRRAARRQAEEVPPDEPAIELCGGRDGIEQRRAVELSDADLGLIAKLDLVEIEGDRAWPIDTKKGKRPHVARSAHDPERVQICAQGLLLRANGWRCDSGFLYFAGSRERVEVPLDDELIELTRKSLIELREVAAWDVVPPPLEDSPKCVGCSLAPICLPDEMRYLAGQSIEVRPLGAGITHRYPLYANTAGALVKKKGDLLEVWAADEKVGEMRMGEVSQLVLMGRAHVTEPAVRELMHREVPVVHLSQGGWLYGVTEGLPRKNIRLRQQQFRKADSAEAALAISRSIVRAKLLNQRVLLRRNADAEALRPALDELRRLARDAERCKTLESLLGIEGRGARVYFEHFSAMLKPTRTDSADAGFGSFDFAGRNRRPPKDPVNALLSFAYAMLTREWVSVCRSVGFDPYLGFLHQPRHGRPALALDLMEPFRPIIADSVVVRVINNGEISRNDFISRMGAVNLTAAGRRSFLQAFEARLGQEIRHPVFGYRADYRRVFEIEARLLARHLLGETPTYSPLITR
jgi:CRISPR-associated endonuclease Cas1/CRISPR-associated protein Cas4